MSQICSNSWGANNVWTFCNLPKGHAGPCLDWRGEPKPEGDTYFSDHPTAQQEIDKAIELDRKREAKRGVK